MARASASTMPRAADESERAETAGTHKIARAWCDPAHGAMPRIRFENYDRENPTSPGGFRPRALDFGLSALGLVDGEVDRVTYSGSSCGSCSRATLRRPGAQGPEP
jgi:hypothetical protein